MVYCSVLPLFVRFILVFYCMFNSSAVVTADNYDFTKSTEDNYASKDSNFVGPNAEFRAMLDYSYHSNYVPERQLFQDKLMSYFNATFIQDDNGMVCDRPTSNWVVFTAGAMGAGKSHTLVWLNHNCLFPLDSFVRVDPDSLREMLPETKEYIKRDPATAGMLTQKEVGYISEILTLNALQQGMSYVYDN